MLSGLQHFAYCRRQWALIHVEQQWNENERTIDGQLFHKRAHDSGATEKRGDTIITRGLHIKSAVLGISGICDVVEFHKSEDGITLFSFDGKWQPYPVEYKKGEPKEHNADELQLCAQAMCLEEMLLCSIPEGSLFYGATRRRTPVRFTEELRAQVTSMVREMHELWEKGYTPKVKPQKGCNACSLKEICVPKLEKTKKVSSYIAGSLGEK
jgi:CRISPR-associated exonuclease Cas4